MVERLSKVREEKNTKRVPRVYFEIRKSCKEIEDTCDEIYDLFFARLEMNPKEGIYRILPFAHIPRNPYKDLFSKITNTRRSILSRIDELNDNDKEKLLKFVLEKKIIIPLNRALLGEMDGVNRHLMDVLGDLYRIYGAMEKKLLKGIG